MSRAAVPLHSERGSAQYPLVYFWSGFGQEQEKWPLPSTTLLIFFFLAGCLVPIVGGAVGIILLFIAAALFPSKQIRKFFSRGDLISVLSITTAAMMVGNFDALGDIYGSDTIRFSWILLALSSLVIPVRLQRLRGRLVACCIAIGVLVGFNVISSIGNTEILRAVEVNGSYFAAFLLITINLVRRNTRDAFVFHLVLIIAVNCGFSLFEMLIPSNGVSISSSKIGDMTIRSAGIYANAITSGMMAANTLLLASICSTKTNSTSKEKLSMFVFMGVCGIGVVATFSRSAAVSIFLAGVLAAFRLSNNQFGRLMQYAPFALGLLVVSFLGVGEYLTQQGGLKRDATMRYDMVKTVFTGDVSPIFEAVQGRMAAWRPSRKYWQRPRIAGYGFGVIGEKELVMPHNMIILTLAETGWIGLLLLLTTLFYLSGFGNWRLTSQNMALFLSIALPLLLIIVESHSLFTRRYYAVYLALLAFASSVLFQPGNAKDR